MKTTQTNQSYCSHAVRHYPYPGAAEPGYFAQKLQNGIEALVTGMGAVTVFFLLVIL